MAMLRVDLRDLQHGPVETTGEVAADDALFEGLGFAFVEPVRVTGRLQATGESGYYWRGHLHARVRLECGRCLADLERPVDADISVLFSTDSETADEDPDAYPLPPTTTAIDLAPVVRDELALAVPAFPLCRPECAGLCARCGADLNAGPCGCTSAEPS
ncbi:MAG TPA: DUF177 domain-containing protein [Gemmatimonadales bacterium]|nr:DUF177 domain-containing protein [Gemmatimonadales bacterium]